MVDLYNIILIRHGQSEANVQRLYGADLPLSPEGRKQALSMSEFYKSLDIDRVYSSRLLRTRETEKLVFGKSVPKSRQLKIFNEIEFGDVDGWHRDKIKASGFKNSYDGDFVGFMSEIHGDDPYKRADECLTYFRHILRLMYDHPNAWPHGTAAIVTSDSLMRCMFLTLKDEHNWRKLSDLSHINNLAGIKLVFDDAYFVIDFDVITDQPGDKELGKELRKKILNIEDGEYL